MILGTPHISFDLGMPDWLTAVIILVLLTTYFGIKKAIERRRLRKVENESTDNETHTE